MALRVWALGESLALGTESRNSYIFSLNSSNEYGPFTFPFSASRMVLRVFLFITYQIDVYHKDTTQTQFCKKHNLKFPLLERLFFGVGRGVEHELV